MPIEVKAVQKISLPEQIMEQIASQITGGRLRPGERLPSERDLAQRFQVTRNCIREALRALSLLGLVTIKPGGGNFVALQDQQLPRDTIIWMYRQDVHNFDEIYDARRLIETEVYMTFFSNRTEDVLSVMRQRIDALEDLCAPEVGAEIYVDALDAIDLLVGEHCGHRIYCKLMQTIVTLRREYALKSSNVMEARKKSAGDRKKIMNAFLSGDESKVKKSLDNFFKQALFISQ
jgi:DNA-binding FadR family transcriptional regulator